MRKKGWYPIKTKSTPGREQACRLSIGPVEFSQVLVRQHEGAEVVEAGFQLRGCHVCKLKSFVHLL